MKTAIIIFAFMSISSSLVFSAEEKPQKPACVGIGTRSEGWSIPGEKIRYDKCSNKVVECSAIGTRSEGWYMYEKEPAGLLKYDKCAETSAAVASKPVLMVACENSEAIHVEGGVAMRVKGSKTIIFSLAADGKTKEIIQIPDSVSCTFQAQ